MTLRDHCMMIFVSFNKQQSRNLAGSVEEGALRCSWHWQSIDREVENTPFMKTTIPIVIANNGGYDSAELITQLRAKYPAGGDAGGWTCITREKSQT
eukprot:scaffold2917_cov282-Chaetoceros_neogracile.AAC.25